jgi:hypothetical protein
MRAGLNNELATWTLPVVHRPHVASGAKALGWEMWIGSTIIGLILLALAVAGAWSWYEAQSKNQKMETAAQDVRETAECHLEAFKLRPGLTETDLEVQAAFMDFCMEARGYVFLPSCTPNAGRTPYSLGYKFNSLCWRKN